MRKFNAKNIMSQPVISFQKQPTVGEIVRILKETRHNGFPVTDHQNRFLGLVLRNQLITLLQKRDFRGDAGVSTSNLQFPSDESIRPVNTTISWHPGTTLSETIHNARQSKSLKWK